MNKKVVCIGAVLIDELFFCKEAVIAGTSNPATSSKSAGGVMRNIAHQLVLLDVDTTLITVAGNDSDGAWLFEKCKAAGIDMSSALIANCQTGKYVAILQPDGSLYTAAAVNPCEKYLDISLLEKNKSLLLAATIIIADTNLSPEVLAWLIAFCFNHRLMLCLEPVSVSKAKKLAVLDLHGVHMLTPNEEELTSLNIEALNTEESINKLQERGVEKTWLRKGANGSVLYSNGKSLKTVAPAVTVKDTTGAGDAALAGYIAAYCMGLNECACIRAGHATAAMIIQIPGAIDASMNKQKLLTAITAYYPHEQTAT